MEDGVSNGRAAAAVRGDRDARPSTRRRGPGPEEGRTAVAGHRPAAEDRPPLPPPPPPPPPCGVRMPPARRQTRGGRAAAATPASHQTLLPNASLSLSLSRRSLLVFFQTSRTPLGGLIYHMPGYRTNRGRTTRGAAAFRTYGIAGCCLTV